MGRHRNKKRKRKGPPAGATLKNQQQIAPAAKLSFWLRSHKILWAILGGLAILGTLVEIYPWLSVQDGPILDPSNPYSEMFQLTNSGYIPVTNLGCLCTPTAAFGSRLLLKNSSSGWRIPGTLAHNGFVSIPCFNLFDPPGIFSPSPGAVLDIDVGYTMLHFIHRRQSFHFKAVIGTGNQQHWQFLGS
jgi:hypothetical protein